MFKITALRKLLNTFFNIVIDKTIDLLESKPHEWSSFWRKAYIFTFPLSPVIYFGVCFLLLVVAFIVIVIGGAILTIYEHISKVANGGEDQHG